MNPIPTLTTATRALIVTFVCAYLLQVILEKLDVRLWGLNLVDVFGLVPLLVEQKLWVWQFVTYLFLHGGVIHLLVNMLILAFFGPEIEMFLGRRSFLFYFFLCGIGGGVFNFVLNLFFSDVALLARPIVGASAAIYGLLAAFGMVFADRYVLAFFVFPMQAKYFVLLISGVELLMGLEGGAGNPVAHFAHLGGMLVGAAYIYIAFYRPKGPPKNKKKDWQREQLKKKFTLIVNETKSPSSQNGPFWN